MLSDFFVDRLASKLIFADGCGYSGWTLLNVMFAAFLSWDIFVDNHCVKQG